MTDQEIKYIEKIASLQARNERLEMVCKELIKRKNGESCLVIQLIYQLAEQTLKENKGD